MAMAQAPQKQRKDQQFSTLWADQQLARRTANLDVHATLRPPASSEDLALALRCASLPKLTQPANDAPPELALGATIGEGGMGVVRAARQLALGREVAVKSLRAGQATPEAIRKLLHEALITGSLEHPDIIPVYALGQNDDGTPMLVMKRVEGTAWSAVLRDPHHALLKDDPREPLVWHLEVLMRVCHAMAYAHGKGILHRDLKADNVMVGRFGEVYVLDWGIAVALHDDRSGALPLAKDANTVAGTPSCMAPEMVEGAGERLTPRSDVFLLGALLHQIVTGRSRFVGESVYEVLFAAFQCDPYPYADDLPAELRAICDKATARDPQDRYASPAELRHALATFLQHRQSMRLLAAARERRRDFDDALALAQALGALSERPQAALDDAETTLAAAFAEGRLALREALRSWPENEQALTELQSLLEPFILWQLQSGDVKAAAQHLTELPHANAKLQQRLDQDKALADARAQKLAKLESDFDPRIGARTRSFLALMLAVVWSVLPLTVDYLWKAKNMAPTHVGHVATTGIFAAFMIFAAVWARESLFRSKLNRSVIGSGMVAVIGTFISRCFAWYFGLPFVATVCFDLVIIGVVVAMMATTQWRRLFVPAAVYFVGATVAAVRPFWAMEAVAAANLVAMSLVAFAWRPTEYDDHALIMTAAMPLPEAFARGKAHFRPGASVD